MKPTIVIYGSSTGTCQEIAETIASKLGADIIDAASLNADAIASHDNLILGTSTWGAGEMQDDWYDGVKELKSADLSSKTVALFGCGDSESYPDTFCGGMKELYDAAKEAGATVLDGVSADGYTFDESEAVEGDKFVGLASTTLTRTTRQKSASTPGLKASNHHSKLHVSILSLCITFCE